MDILHWDSVELIHVHESTGLATQWSRVRIPSEAAQCFFHCLPSDFALLTFPPCLLSLVHIHV